MFTAQVFDEGLGVLKAVALGVYVNYPLGVWA